MKCPECRGMTKTVDSRPTAYGHRRRYECLFCKHRFTTAEITRSEYKSMRKNRPAEKGGAE